MFEPDIVCMQEVQWMGVIFYKFKLSVVRAVEFKSDITSALVSDTVGLICKLIPLAVPTTPLLGATTRLVLYTMNREHTRVCQAALFLTELDQIAPGRGYRATILTTTLTMMVTLD